MRDKEKPIRFHLNEKQIEELKELYQHKGWKVTWIAMKFNIHHSTVSSKVREHSLERHTSILKKMPKDVEEIYNTIRLPKAKFPDYDSYIRSDYDHKLKLIREDCSHEHFTIICPVCRQVLGSEANHIITRKNEATKNSTE